MLNQSVLYSRLSKTISNNAIPALDASPVLAAAVGFFAAYYQQVPGTAVKGYDNYYNDNIAPGTRSIICEVNEGAVFDVRQALDYARKFWIRRYTTLHASFLYTDGDSELDFFNITSGVGIVFSPEEYKLINQYKRTIIQLAKELIAIKKELTDAGSQ